MEAAGRAVAGSEPRPVPWSGAMVSGAVLGGRWRRWRRGPVEGHRAARRRALGVRAVALAAPLIALVAGCAREPDPDVIPAGRGWECKLDVCERTCTPRLLKVEPEKPCERRATAFCMTWVEGASGKPTYYCASDPRFCEDINVGQRNGVLGEKPARRVSPCAELP